MTRTLRGNYNPKQNANTRRNCGGKNTKNNRPKVNEQRGKEKKGERNDNNNNKMSERENGLKRIPFKKENPKK